MAAFDVSEIHKLLDQAEQLYHKLFKGHVPAEVQRFSPHLGTVRMVLDQSAAQAEKDQG